MPREPLGDDGTEPAAGDAAADEQQRNPPVDQPGDRIVERRGEAEGADREQRGADRVDDAHSGGQNQAGNDQEASSDAEKSGERAGGEADHAEADDAGAAFADRPRRRRPRAHHEKGDDQHQQREQQEQALAIDQLADR
jgi:hypothetical protein